MSLPSISKRKRTLRNKKIAVAIYHYVHHTTDLASIADMVNVDVETLAEWQVSPQWQNEMNYYLSERNQMVSELGLEQINTQEAEVNGSLTTFAWLWSNILQEGIDLDDIENLKKIGGIGLNSEHHCKIVPIGIENVFQRCLRLLRIGYRNVRTLISILF